MTWRGLNWRSVSKGMRRPSSSSLRTLRTRLSWRRYQAMERWRAWRPRAGTWRASVNVVIAVPPCPHSGGVVDRAGGWRRCWSRAGLRLRRMPRGRGRLRRHGQGGSAACRVRRFEAKLEFEDGVPAVEVAAVAEDGVEVVQHALEDLAAGDRCEERLGIGGPDLERAEPGEQLRAVNAGALLERVDVDGVLGAAVADDEVARGTNAIALEPDALGNFHVHKRKRYGDPGAPLDYLIEVAVRRVGIVFGVPVEAMNAKELVLDG